MSTNFEVEKPDIKISVRQTFGLDSDMDENEIERFIKSDLTWHKPTKSFRSSENFFKILWENTLDDKTNFFNKSNFKNSKKTRFSEKDRDALEVLGFREEANWPEIQ